MPNRSPRQYPQAQVRFYVDADLLGLAKLLVQAIQGHSREVGAVYEHGARMIALAGDAARTKFEQLEVVMANWRRIERCVAEPGPFIYVATRTTFRPFTEK